MELVTTDLELKTIELAETQSLHVSLKTVNGKLAVDARKWNKFHGMDDFIPTKKGLMLDLNQWKQLIPLIQAMIDENEVARAV